MEGKLHSYDERLYETIDEISPCPYCGCDRIVIHTHDDSYMNPDEYRVEHVDEKQAVTADCFDMYYTFGSVEDAVSKANERGYAQTGFAGMDYIGGEYYCGRCRHKVSDHDSYCSECGGELRKSKGMYNVRES